jgi:hypothetical protein
LALLLQTLSKCFNWFSSSRTNNEVHELQNNAENQQQQQQQQQITDEENSVILDGCLSVKTWLFLIPSKKHGVNIVIHSVMASLTSMAAGHFLLPSSIDRTLGNGIPPLVITTFGWFSVIQALHSLIVVAPPETATFR